MFDTARARLQTARLAAYAPILEPGEQLLAAGLVAGAFIGRDDIETAASAESASRIEAIVHRAMARVDDLPPLPKGFVRVAGAAAAVLDPSLPSPDVERLLGGRVGHGGIDSVASVFKSALAGTQPDLFVTDRRVGLAVDTDERVAVEASSVPVAAKRAAAAVPRVVVHGVRRRRRLLEWGRLELAFTDGSQITVTAGMFLTTRANRLFRALTAPFV